ncbi:hypothetical protein FWH13_02290 [Candidatus Saccharibacteria bacterium]|nr:hypothetical protein [Candidatus Saccharibacteria bacterium]
MTRQLRGYIKITHPGKKVSKTVVDESLKNLEAAYADAACKDAAYKVLDALGLEYDAANNKWIKVRKEVRECKITCEEEGSAGSTGVDDSGGSKKKTWRNRYTSGS